MSEEIQLLYTYHLKAEWPKTEPHLSYYYTASHAELRTYVDAVYCYRPSSVVCLSVGLSVKLVSPAKTTELIEMPFGLRTGVGPWNRVLDLGLFRPDIHCGVLFPLLCSNQCWLGGRKGIRPVKYWGMVEVGTDWSGWSGAQSGGLCVDLPLLIFPCTIQTRSSLLWHRLTRVVPEKGRKTVVVCCSSYGKKQF